MEKTGLVKLMRGYLENALASLAAGDRAMFHYNAGGADAISVILDELFILDDEYMDEHIQNMLDIIDENW